MRSPSPPAPTPIRGLSEPEYDDHGLLARDETEETVSVPALEDRDEYLSDKGTPDDDPGDHRGQPWATTTGTPHAGADADADTGAEEGQATEGALGSRMDPTTESRDRRAEPTATPSSGRRRDTKVEGPRMSRASTRSSTAASASARQLPSPTACSPWATPSRQPRRHDLRGPDDAGYDDAEPDVWFYNEEAARRAGFRTRGGVTAP